MTIALKVSRVDVLHQTGRCEHARFQVRNAHIVSERTDRPAKPFVDGGEKIMRRAGVGLIVLVPCRQHKEAAKSLPQFMRRVAEDVAGLPELPGGFSCHSVCYGRVHVSIRREVIVMV